MLFYIGYLGLIKFKNARLIEYNGKKEKNNKEEQKRKKA